MSVFVFLEGNSVQSTSTHVRCCHLTLVMVFQTEAMPFKALGLVTLRAVTVIAALTKVLREGKGEVSWVSVLYLTLLQ